jgi:hypothetical protein
MKPRSPLVSSGLFSITFCLISGIVSAATLSIPTVTSPGSGLLSGPSTINWAIWANNSNNTATSLAPTNTRANSTGIISAITNLGGGTNNVRSSTNTSPYDSVSPQNRLSYTGGTSPAAQTNVTAVGVFSTSFTSGQGIGLTISQLAALPAGQSYQINLWAAAFNADAVFLASTDGGATTSTVTYDRPSDSGKPLNRYTFTYNPDDISEVLSLALSSTDVTTTTGANPHVVIQAVDISIVPEPSSAMLLLGAAGALALRRRRD